MLNVLCVICHYLATRRCWTNGSWTPSTEVTCVKLDRDIKVDTEVDVDLEVDVE